MLQCIRIFEFSYAYTGILDDDGGLPVVKRTAQLYSNTVMKVGVLE